MSVRYFAGAAAEAGTDEEQITLMVPPPLTLATLLDEVTARHGAGLARILAACSFIVNEVTATGERTLDDGARVDVLPPFAGG
ncbi:MAG: sulfur-carrier protein [Actinomycetota bacterium]|nr:sulfur-carrier protein [Actinomycetota bacterium]